MSSAEIAEFFGDDGTGAETADEPLIQVDSPLDLRPDLTELGIIEVERGVCEDTYENRSIIRRAKMEFRPVYDQYGRATGLLSVESAESRIERRIVSLSEKRPLLVDPDNRNSDYLTGLDLLLDDAACAITPPWVIGATKRWVAQEANGGVPEKGRRRSEGLPGRCRTIKADTIRCMLWHSGRPKDDGLCRVHLKSVRKAGEDVERARMKLTQAAPYAVDVLEELMETAESEPVRLKASTEILDRAGVRGGQDFTVDVEVNDTRSAAQVVMERLARLAQGAAMIQSRLDQAELEAEDAEVVSETPPGGLVSGDKSPQTGQEADTVEFSTELSTTSPGQNFETTPEDGGLGVKSKLNSVNGDDFDDDLEEEARS